VAVLDVAVLDVAGAGAVAVADPADDAVLLPVDVVAGALVLPQPETIKAAAVATVSNIVLRR
jgi:hypothetical protein